MNKNNNCYYYFLITIRTLDFHFPLSIISQMWYSSFTCTRGGFTGLISSGSTSLVIPEKTSLAPRPRLSRLRSLNRTSHNKNRTKRMTSFLMCISVLVKCLTGSDLICNLFLFTKCNTLFEFGFLNAWE